MKKGVLVLCGLVLCSCGWFETERISSETFFEEEMEMIAWDDVDHYPTFTPCGTVSEKEVQKSCFETTLGTHMNMALKSRNLATHLDVEGQLMLELWISPSPSDPQIAVLENVQITPDSIVVVHFPLLANWLMASLDSLPAMAPANKRGIPVKTKFTYPISLKSETLKD